MYIPLEAYCFNIVFNICVHTLYTGNVLYHTCSKRV